MWSAEAREKGGQNTDPVVNYNTYVLGREGYVSLNLITSSSTVESDKPAAHELLAAVNFNDGKRYGDFNSPPTRSRPMVSRRWSAASPRRSSGCSLRPACSSRSSPR